MRGNVEKIRRIEYCILLAFCIKWEHKISVTVWKYKKKIDYRLFIFFRNADKKLQIEGEVSGKVFHFDENSHVLRANEKICSEDAELSPGKLRRIESC